MMTAGALRGDSRRRKEGRAAEGIPLWWDQRGSCSPVTLVVLPQQQVLSPDMLNERVSHTAHLTQNTEITRRGNIKPVVFGINLRLSWIA